MKSTMPIIFLILITLGCSNVSNSNNISDKKTKTKGTDSVTVEVSDFNVFFEKFNTDSTFQFSSIEFPLKLISTEEDGKKESVINKQEWKFTKLSEQAKLKSKIKKKIVSNQEVQIEYSIEDTGVLVNHYFQYKNRSWVLTRIEDHSN